MGWRNLGDRIAEVVYVAVIGSWVVRGWAKGGESNSDGEESRGVGDDYELVTSEDYE